MGENGALPSAPKLSQGGTQRNQETKTCNNNKKKSNRAWWAFDLHYTKMQWIIWTNMHFFSETYDAPCTNTLLQSVQWVSSHTRMRVSRISLRCIHYVYITSVPRAMQQCAVDALDSSSDLPESLQLLPCGPVLLRLSFIIFKRKSVADARTGTCSMHSDKNDVRNQYAQQ